MIKTVSKILSPQPCGHDNLTQVKSCTNKRIGKWVALYEFGGLEKEEHAIFLDHLIECEHCYDQVYSLEQFTTGFRTHKAAARQSRLDGTFAPVQRVVKTRSLWWNWRPTIMVGASIALAICIGVVVFIAQISETRRIKIPDRVDGTSSVASNTSRWKEITVPKASYTPPSERVILRGPGEAFNRAMVLYQQNDFAGAVEQLEPLSELEPDNAVEVKFYLGVCLLMVGRNQDAILPFRQAVQFTISPRRESSHYYLALAYLKCDYQDQALDELDETIEMNGEHRSAARELKRQIFAQTK